MAAPSKPRVLSASTLSNNPVFNPQGDKLGKIEEFMLDMPTGQVSYAVLSFGGVLGFGDKLFAIPWNALRLDTERHAFVLDVDRSTLERAQGFDKDHWPDFADARLRTQLHDLYKVQP